jgi:hypothetical protein
MANIPIYMKQSIKTEQWQREHDYLRVNSFFKDLEKVCCVMKMQLEHTYDVSSTEMSSRLSQKIPVG